MPNSEGIGAGGTRERLNSPLSRYPGLEITLRGEVGVGDSDESFEAMANPPLSFERVVEILSADANALHAAKLILDGKDVKPGFDFEVELSRTYSAKVAWAVLDKLTSNS
jgi:hypothetical protein